MSDFSGQKYLVLSAFRDESVVMTRNQIADTLGIPLASACGRANELLRERVLAVRGEVMAPTGRPRELLGLKIDKESMQ